MQGILNFIESDYYMYILSLVVVLLFIGFISVLIINTKINNKYKKFMKKLGNGENIQEDLQKFMDSVYNVQKQNIEISNDCKIMKNDISKCVQKIGLVRYSAFRDTGSDLSFAVALLDEKNNGIVFNGIYSREMSNIYAKPVENGTSTYTLSEEEIQAIEKAKN